MSRATIDGITTDYEVIGSGPALLMVSPGGFDASRENWSSLGVYAELQLLDHLAEQYTCITYDRRESGHSGGRVERVGWSDYVTQARSLLDHLGIEQAHIMGGCVGCSVVAAFAAAHPERTTSMVLFWPAGGPRYRMTQHQRIVRHLAYVSEVGLPGVVELATSTGVGFAKDPRVGPWVTVIRTDPAFADTYAGLDPARYQTIVSGMGRVMFDRDTVPGAEPEDLMGIDVPALIVPGDDASHARSAARYLAECLPLASYWDVPVSEQTAASVPARVLDFLAAS